MRTFSVFAATKNFDKATGLAKGVSVIQVGPALGHDTNVDQTTLGLVVKAAKAHPDGVKVHIQHDSDLKDVVGFLTNFKIDGDHVRADLKLLKMSPWFGYLCELIETNPNAFGLSISCDGPNEAVDGENYLRVNHLWSVDLVSDPAANRNGLFSSKVFKDRTRMSKEAAEAAKVALDSADGDGDNDLASRIGVLEEGFAKLSDAIAKMADSGDDSDNGADEDSEGADDDEENAEDAESEDSDDMSALKAELAAAKEKIAELESKSTSASKLAARKLAATGVKADKRVKTSTDSTPTLKQQFEALKTPNERLQFYRKHASELKEEVRG
jgi:hypothetical protein